MKKILLSCLAALAIMGTHATAQILTSSIVQGLSTTNALPVSVTGDTDYAIFTTPENNGTDASAIEGTPDSFSTAVLTNSSTTVGSNTTGANSEAYAVLNSNTGAFTFSGYSGASTTSASNDYQLPLGGSAEYGYENGKLTFSQTVLAPTEVLTLYTNAKYVDITLTATLTGPGITTPLVTSVSTSDATSQGAPNDGNLAAVSTFDLTGAAAGDTLTFVETYQVPNSGNNRFYMQSFLDGATVVATVPEPSTYALIGLGLFALVAITRFRTLSA
jgi:hypothetical protein